MRKIKRETEDILLNRAVQLVFFLFLPDLYATAFNGVKYMAFQLGMTEVIQITPFVAVLITLLVYTFAFGRFFCGYACAFGFLGDLVFDLSGFLQKKIKEQRQQ
ncbi:MAG: 4Fe-4S binding protein [Anaerovoracaceae bacterium]